MARGIADRRVEGVRQAMQHPPCESALIDDRTSQRLVPINADRFAGIDDSAVAFERVADIDLAFLHADGGRFVVLFHAHLKGRSADGNHRSRSVNPIRIGLIAQMLDMDSYTPHQYVQQIAPVWRILAEDNVRVRIDLEGTAVGNLELRGTVRSGDDDLLYLDAIADL